jgi:hypothetical protein
MHKLLISSALAGVYAHPPQTTTTPAPTLPQADIGNIANRCDFDGMVETSFLYRAPTNHFLGNVRAGRCDKNNADAALANIQITVAAVDGQADTYEYKILYNAQICAEANDYVPNAETLPANSTVNLMIDDMIGSSPLTEPAAGLRTMLLRTHKIISRCEYGTNYKATFEFGHIDQSLNDNGEVIDTGVLSFGMEVYKDLQRTELYAVDETFYSGQMAFVNVFISAGSLPGSSGQSVWAPTSCVFSEIGQADNTYTLFPYADTCGGEFASELNFDIARQSNGNWEFQYKLFIFRDVQLTNYRLECDINLCKTGEQTNVCTDLGDICYNSFSQLVRS